MDVACPTCRTPHAPPRAGAPPGPGVLDAPAAPSGGVWVVPDSPSEHEEGGQDAAAPCVSSGPDSELEPHDGADSD
eukprot:14440530-Alexandrium_andersonii.AAC.1